MWVLGIELRFCTMSFEQYKIRPHELSRHGFLDLIMGSGMGFIWGSGVKSNQKVVGHSYDMTFVPLLHQWACLSRLVLK